MWNPIGAGWSEEASLDAASGFEQPGRGRAGHRGGCTRRRSAASRADRQVRPFRGAASQRATVRERPRAGLASNRSSRTGATPLRGTSTVRRTSWTSSWPHPFIRRTRDRGAAPRRCALYRRPVWRPRPTPRRLTFGPPSTDQSSFRQLSAVTGGRCGGRGADGATRRTAASAVPDTPSLAPPPPPRRREVSLLRSARAWPARRPWQRGARLVVSGRRSRVDHGAVSEDT